MGVSKPLKSDPVSQRHRLSVWQRFLVFNKILPGGTQLHVQNVLIEGKWAVVELESHATAMNGMRFDNRYCWVVRFEDARIVEVRAYLDSALVQKLIDERRPNIARAKLEFYSPSGVGHVDLYAFGRKEYERRIGDLFTRHLIAG